MKYYIPINDVAGTQDSQTVHVLNIEGSRKKRKREFAKYVKAAYGVTNASKLAREMGFKDLV